MKQKRFELTEENKEYLRQNWDRFEIMALARTVSGNPEATGKTIEGRAVKEFLADMGAKPKTTAHIKVEKDVEILPEHIELIRNNPGVSTLELARLIWKDPKISGLHKEFTTLYKFMKDNQISTDLSNEPAEEIEYRVPRSIWLLVPRINRFMKNPENQDLPFYDKDNLTPMQEKCLKALLSYIQIPRFSYLASQYTKRVDRDIYESTFIGMTHDKPDLTREEQDQYISLASEVAYSAGIQKNILTYNQEAEEALDRNSSPEENRKLSANLVELIKHENDRFDKSKERQKKLYAELTVSRADREKLRVEANSSFLKLVDMWKKKSDRDKIIEMAKEKRRTLQAEVQRLDSIDSLRAELFGIDKNSIIN